MGSGGYSYQAFATRSATAKTSAAGMFTHHHAVNTGAARAVVHETLDPSKPNKAGQRIRESRDSDDHPESEAIAVLFDVTGSMGLIPRVMVEKLAALIGVIIKDNVCKHPQILFGAIGDAAPSNGGGAPDLYPLQLGQFESDNRMDENFSNMILEGGGGGQIYESYDLALYYFARHTSIDCFEKRGQKGLLFIIGDERVRAFVNKDEVKRVIGEDNLETDIPIADILEELSKQWKVFFIEPKGGHYWTESTVCENLDSLFQERHIRLEDPNAVCEVITQLIAAEKGLDLDAIRASMKNEGISDSTITASTTAIAAYVGGSLSKTTGKQTGLVQAGSASPLTEDEEEEPATPA